MTLVIVSILNFNGHDRAISCVQSLLDAQQAANGQYELQILLTDNDTGSETYDQLQNAFESVSRVHLKKNSSNLGFAAGHNRNLERIFNMFEPDYIWLLNNDCVVDKQTLPAQLQSARQRPDIGLWGVTLLEEDGKTIQCAGGCLYNSWMSSYRQHGKGTSTDKVRKVKSVDYDYIAGASMFFPVATLLDGLKPLAISSTDSQIKPGQWLNETFFLYFEELDLTQRLRSDLIIGWCRDAKVRHVGGFSARSSYGNRSIQTEYHSSLSALKYTQLYYPRRLWLTAPARFVSKSLVLLFEGNHKLIKPMINAYQDFWRISCKGRISAILPKIGR